MSLNFALIAGFSGVILITLLAVAFFTLLNVEKENENKSKPKRNRLIGIVLVIAGLVSAGLSIYGGLSHESKHQDALNSVLSELEDRHEVELIKPERLRYRHLDQSSVYIELHIRYEGGILEGMLHSDEKGHFTLLAPSPQDAQIMTPFDIEEFRELAADAEE